MHYFFKNQEVVILAAKFVPQGTYHVYPCAVQVTDDLTFFGHIRSHLYSEARGVFEDTNEPMPFRIDHWG